MFTIVLLEPQIPPNTGNIARLCAATGTQLHIVGKLGFDLSDKQLKRAGLDYWNHVDWQHFEDLDAYLDKLDSTRIHLLSSKVSNSYTSQALKDSDFLIYGSETNGIAPDILNRVAKRCITIPMKNQGKGVRCLNLATAAGIVLYEGLRQTKQI